MKRERIEERAKGAGIKHISRSFHIHKPFENFNNIGNNNDASNTNCVDIFWNDNDDIINYHGDNKSDHIG